MNTGRLERVAILAASWTMLWMAGSAGAQVTARQATPEEAAAVEKGAPGSDLTEVSNPMLLEVPLARRAQRRALWELDPGKPWVATETRKFVCDRAKVEHLLVTRTKEKKGRVPVTIQAKLTSEWYRQDVDFTLTLEAEGGKVLARKVWDDLTIGNSGGPYSGHSKTPELKASIPIDVWNAEFADGKAPLIRVLVEIQGEEGDADND